MHYTRSREGSIKGRFELELMSKLIMGSPMLATIVGLGETGIAFSGEKLSDVEIQRVVTLHTF